MLSLSLTKLLQTTRGEIFLHICPRFFSSPASCSRPSSNLSSRSDVISLLSSADTGQSVECRWAVCVCVTGKLACMCIMTWSTLTPSFTLFNYDGKRQQGGCCDQGDEGKTWVETQKLSIKLQTDRQTDTWSKWSRGVFRGHLASGEITVSQSMVYDCCFPCSLQSCHWTNAH